MRPSPPAASAAAPGAATSSSRRPVPLHRGDPDAVPEATVGRGAVDDVERLPRRPRDGGDPPGPGSGRVEADLDRERVGDPVAVDIGQQRRGPRGLGGRRPAGEERRDGGHHEPGGECQQSVRNAAGEAGGDRACKDHGCSERGKPLAARRALRGVM